MRLDAITLIRPMSAAIVWGSKRIENRPRDLPKRMRGAPTIVAVHAGKKWSGDYVQKVREIDGSLDAGHTSHGYRILGGTTYEERMEDEGIVGLMLLSGRVYTSLQEVQLSRTLRSSMRSANWWGGPYGYEIAAALPFPSPIPCRGMQGWWPVPDELEDMISDADAYGDLLERAPADVRTRYEEVVLGYRAA